MRVRLAAYGTLMTGETNHLPDAVRRRMRSLGACRIPGRLFQVRGASGFTYPALVPAFSQTTAGELFTVPASDLKAIDAYEDFRPDDPEASIYIRRRVVVRTGSGSERVWVYLWNRSIAGLSPVAGNAWISRRAR